MKVILYFCLFLISFNVNSVNLTDQLNDFFKKEYPYKKDDIKIILRAPFKKNIFCKKPVFSLLSNIHTFGIIDVLLTCDKKHYYLQVELQSQGEYVVANKKIPRGTKIQESDLKILIGRLDILPNNTYRKKIEVINRVNLRDIFPLQPITPFITRPDWIVHINQQVTVMINGNDFIIYSKAKSLSNGAENEIIRVKTQSGKILTGVIDKKGQIIVSL